MIFRKARLDDAVAIARVQVDTWQTTYGDILPEDYLAQLSYQKREERWRQMLARAVEDNHFIYVVENEVGEIIAFADGGKERSGNEVYQGELYAIYILEAYQRQGIGRSLFHTIINKFVELGFRSILVWVLADNSAYKFYEALGGQKVDTKPIEIGGSSLTEIAYGWTDLGVFRAI
jgi:ribosomal protein S18 acetylase RimI-like enzyme